MRVGYLVISAHPQKAKCYLTYTIDQHGRVDLALPHLTKTMAWAWLHDFGCSHYREHTVRWHFDSMTADPLRFKRKDFAKPKRVPKHIRDGRY